MTKTYQQIQQQIESLRQEAEVLRAKEARDVIERIRVAMKTYGLSARDLGPEGARRRAANGKPPKAPAATNGKAGAKNVAVRFRDEAGNTWVGRGPRPKWVRAALEAGGSLQDFAV